MLRTLFSIFVMLSIAMPAVAEPIEDFFAARGPFDTVSEFSTGPRNEFTLFRPTEPGGNGTLHPVITWGNGTFLIPLLYFDFLDHLASHGFVVIASDDLFTGSGEAMLEGVDWILAQNDDPASALFQTIDTESIGATGHSQGGQGTINAGNDPRISCTAPIEPVPGNVAGLTGPMFVTAGRNDRIVPALWVAVSVYLPSQVPSVFGILSGADHLDAIGDADGFRGYVTAWFAFCLNGDAFAREAFVGACELCSNADWSAVRK